MYRDITKKQLRIVTAVCAFSFSIAQVNAQDQQFPAWSTKSGTVEVRGVRGKDRPALHVIYDVSTHPCDFSIRAFLRSSRSPGAAV